jgi:uncharacterized damage-inducible protein DinB
MITSILITLFEKELDKLKEELAAYEQDDQVWKTAEGISNSGGNLCLHLTGNLQHFIGATLGETGYIRNREAEFKLKNIPRHKLLEEVDNARQVVTDTLEQLSKKELETEYPIQVTDEPMSTQAFLIYLLKHLSYHIGQINYHRRLVK